ncbi:hypothetical protein ACEPAI_2485 [Sanghuangporus weigelae]
MYKLLRRISSSFKGRFDRKQEGAEEDGGASSSTASTPKTGSKRRMSDDSDDVPNGTFTKRSRGHTHDDERVDELGATRLHDNESETATSTPDGDDPAVSAPPGLPRKDTEGVRHVTKGVKEVELEDKKGKGKEKEPTGEEKEADAKEADLTSEKSEDDSPSEEAETNETTEAKHVADAEPVVVERTKSPEPEVSEDETPIKATASPDTPEESSERIPEVADTSVNAETNTQATASPTNDEVSVPTPTIEPFVKLSSDEAIVKVQG